MPDEIAFMEFNEFKTGRNFAVLEVEGVPVFLDHCLFKYIDPDLSIDVPIGQSAAS